MRGHQTLFSGKMVICVFKHLIKGVTQDFSASARQHRRFKFAQQSQQLLVLLIDFDVLN